MKALRGCGCDGCGQSRVSICPECANGKHRNCDGSAWDDVEDDYTRCGCTHGEHAAAPVPPGVTVTDRGFKYLDPVLDDDGNTVRVHESSAAMGAHLWLTVTGGLGVSSAHLTLDQARCRSRP